jgi:hypothetical protein
MKTTLRFVYAIAMIACFSVASRAQLHQSSLYIDDLHGHFTVLQAANGGGTLTLPAGGGMLQSSGGTAVVSTEVDTAKAANTATITGTTGCATIVSNGSTTDVTATVSTGTSGQILYVFNNLGTTHKVSVNGVALIADNQIGIFIYLAGTWRLLALSPAI